MTNTEFPAGRPVGLDLRAGRPSVNFEALAEKGVHAAPADFTDFEAAIGV